MYIRTYYCTHQPHGGVYPCRHRCNDALPDPKILLAQAERSLSSARDLVLEMRRLLMKHAPIADAEVIAALALSHELVGD